jgi:hypothetical protein
MQGPTTPDTEPDAICMLGVVDAPGAQ